MIIIYNIIMKIELLQRLFCIKICAAPSSAAVDKVAVLLNNEYRIYTARLGQCLPYKLGRRYTKVK